MRIRNDIQIRTERSQEFEIIDTLVKHSFSEGTNISDGIGEVALIHEIRQSPYYIPELSFVAVKEDKIVGHLMFSQFSLAKTKDHLDCYDKDAKLVLLAPVAVHIDHLREGIGSTMLQLGIEKVKEAGYRGIILEGNYRFYETLGFQTSAHYHIYPTGGYPLTEPRCLMCMEMYPEALKEMNGYVIYLYENA